MTRAIVGLLLLAGCTGAPLGDRVINVVLAYGDGTNAGAEAATGSALIDTGSGQVDIMVSGLEALDGEIYEGWLAGGGDETTSTGRFNVDSRGIGGSNAILGDLTARTFTRVFISIEPEPDSSAGPDPRRTIEGEIN